MIVYHNSNHLFKVPSMEMIQINTSNHENGLLGLWFSMSNTWQKSFGVYGYSIAIPEDFKMKEIGISDFVLICNKNVDFLQVRTHWINEGYDVVGIIENDGVMKMGILLNLNVKMEMLK